MGRLQVVRYFYKPILSPSIHPVAVSCGQNNVIKDTKWEKYFTFFYMKMLYIFTDKKES